MEGIPQQRGLANQHPVGHSTQGMMMSPSGGGSSDSVSGSGPYLNQSPSRSFEIQSASQLSSTATSPHNLYQPQFKEQDDHMNHDTAVEDEGVTHSYISHFPTSLSTPSSATLASAAVQRHTSAAATANSNAATNSKLPYLSFQYTLRLGFVLLPTLFILLAAGGRPLITILCIGGICAYLLDQLGTPEGAFVTTWLSLIGGMVSLALWHNLKSYTLFATLLLIHLNLILFLMGVYLSCHYEFLVRELISRTGIWGNAERLLFGTLFLPVTVIEVLASFGLGAEFAPWAMCIILWKNYYCLIQPLPTSQQLCEAGLDTKSISILTAPTKTRQLAPGERRAKVVLPPAIPLDELEFVLSPILAAGYTILFCGLPYTLNLAVHHNFLLDHLISSEGMLLGIIQLLAYTIVAREDFLWFTPIHMSMRSSFRRVSLIGSSFIFIFLLEYRVLIPVFGKYLILKSNWPLLCFVVLTIGLYSGMCALGLLYLGLEKHGPGGQGVSQTKVNGFKFLLHVSAICIGISVGLPFWTYIFVILGSIALAQILLNQNPVAFSCVTLLWSGVLYLVINHLVGFLEFNIRQTELIEHASQYMFNSQCFMMWFQGTLGLILPLGYLIAGRLHSFISSSSAASANVAGPFTVEQALKFIYAALDSTFCLYIILLAGLEWDWIRMDSRGAYDTTVYGWYLVVLTSLMTGILAYYLSPKRLDKISGRGYVALMTLAIWKLGVLFFDDKRDFWTFLLFVAAQVPIYLSYDPELYPHQSFHQTSKMTVQQGQGHILFLALAMWLSKNTILAHILHWTGLYLGQLTTESTYLGLFLLGLAISSLPISFHHFGYSPNWRRWNVIGLGLATLWFLIQPRLEFLSWIGLGLDDESDVFERGMLIQQPAWPGWILFGALTTLILTFASATTSVASGHTATHAGTFLPRPLLALILGTSCGIYLVGLFLPFQPLLYGLIVLMCNLVAIFIIYLFLGGRKTTVGTSVGAVHAPVHESTLLGVWHSALSVLAGGSNIGHSNSNLLPVTYCLFVTLLPLTYLTVGLVYSPSRIHGASSHGIHIGHTRHGSAANEIQTLYRVATLAIHTTLNFLLALSVNVHREVAAAVTSKEARFKNLQLYGVSTGVGVNSKNKEAAALLFLGNLATIGTVLSAAYLHLSYLNGTLWGIFALSPILLLLNADHSSWFGSLTEERKWWPMAAGACSILIYSACLDLFLRPLLGPITFGLIQSTSRTAIKFGSWMGIKNLILLIFLLPSLSYFMEYLWWHSKRRVDGFKLAILAPINLFPLLFTDLLSIQLLAGIGFVGILIQVWSLQVNSRKGMRLI